MPTFILLTRRGDDIACSFSERYMLEQSLKTAVADACPDVEWLASFTVSGPYDYLDILVAPDAEAATKISLLAKTIAGGAADIWAATEWTNYKKMALGISPEPADGDGRAGCAMDTESSIRFADLPVGAISAIAALRPSGDELKTAWSLIRGGGDLGMLANSSRTAAIYWIIAQHLPQSLGKRSD